MSKDHHKRSRRIIKSFKAKSLKKRPFSIRIADALTSQFGTLGFLVLNIIFFTLWVLANSGKIPGIPIFDPYPFVLLITAVSLEAILLAVVVLISQNREGYINTLRDELQLQVNLITEREITKVLILLKQLLKKHDIEITDKDLNEMLKEIDASYIERKLEAEISGKPKSLIQKVTKAGEKMGKSLSPNKK